MGGSTCSIGPLPLFLLIHGCQHKRITWVCISRKSCWPSHSAWLFTGLSTCLCLKHSATELPPWEQLALLWLLVSDFQMQTSATRVWDTRELAPSPARYLGTRGVWKGRLSLREQLCTGFQKKTVGKSCDSLLILIALRCTYVVHKHQLDLLGKIPRSGNWSLKNQPGHWNVAFLPQMK